MEIVDEIKKEMKNLDKLRNELLEKQMVDSSTDLGQIIFRLTEIINQLVKIGLIAIKNNHKN